MIAENRLYAGLATKTGVAIGMVRQALVESTGQIKDDPSNPSLLYQQAKGLLQLGLYEQALTIAKYACELCSESTSAWVLLAKCFFLNKFIHEVPRLFHSRL